MFAHGCGVLGGDAAVPHDAVRSGMAGAGQSLACGRNAVYSSYSLSGEKLMERFTAFVIVAILFIMAAAFSWHEHRLNQIEKLAQQARATRPVGTVRASKRAWPSLPQEQVIALGEGLKVYGQSQRNNFLWVVRLP